MTSQGNSQKASSESCSDVNRKAIAFFEMDFEESKKYYWASPDSRSLGDRHLHRQLVGFEGRALFTVRKGRIAGDFIGNDFVLLVVSDRVLTLLKGADISGYTTFQVDIIHEGSRIDGYTGLGISGRGGKNDDRAYAGGMIPGTRIRKVRGLFPTQWDGSDLFTLDDIPGAVLATERVKKVLQTAKVTNCMFIPAEEFSIGTGPLFEGR